MNYDGLIIGAVSFLIIGVFHPIVIKAEYYAGKGVWPVFLIVGIACIATSLFISNYIFSIILGLVGFSCLWSINEIIEQEERVEKGWFPANPKRKKKK